jgi:hypothetical protein
LENEQSGILNSQPTIKHVWLINLHYQVYIYDLYEMGPKKLIMITWQPSSAIVQPIRVAAAELQKEAAKNINHYPRISIWYYCR